MKPNYFTGSSESVTVAPPYASGQHYAIFDLRSQSPDTLIGQIEVHFGNMGHSTVSPSASRRRARRARDFVLAVLLCVVTVVVLSPLVALGIAAPEHALLALLSTLALAGVALVRYRKFVV